MNNALFGFADAESGRDALRRLDALRLPSDALTVHQHTEGPGDRLRHDIDEQITGGLFGNLYHLFGQLMEWGGEPHDPAPYAELVRDGGTVLSIRAATDDERDRIEQALREAPVVLRSEWSPVAVA